MSLAALLLDRTALPPGSAASPDGAAQDDRTAPASGSAASPDGDHALAAEGIAALSALHVASGGKLPLGLISDEELPAGSPLAKLFRPPAQRVTVASELGARLPDAVVFRTALSRLVNTAPPIGSAASLGNADLVDLPVNLATAMFVTADPGHAAAARRLGLTTWQLGADLADWSQVPLLVAWTIGDVDPAGVRAAYALRVHALFRETVHAVQRVDRANHRTYATLAGEPPQDVVLELDPSGDIVALDHVLQTARDQKFQSSLEDNATLAAPGDDLAAGQTHKVETGPVGPRPRRKRFSIT